MIHAGSNRTLQQERPLDRHTIAYLIIALMVFAAAGAIAFKLYHSRERSYQRRLRRDEANYASRMADQTPEDS
jgi:hypothetical protein